MSDIDAAEAIIAEISCRARRRLGLANERRQIIDRGLAHHRPMECLRGRCRCGRIRSQLVLQQTIVDFLGLEKCC